MYGDSAGAHSYDDNDEYGYDEEEIDYAMRGMSMQDSHNRQVKIVHGAIAAQTNAHLCGARRTHVPPRQSLDRSDTENSCLHQRRR